MKPVYLLDTCTVSEVAKPAPNERLLLGLESKSAQCAISTVTWSELLFGYHLLSDGRRKQAVYSFLYDYVQESFPQLHFDEHAASVLADFRVRCCTTGKTADMADLMIASIAVANNLILVTRNTKHFEPLQEFSPLMLDNWWEK